MLNSEHIFLAFQLGVFGYVFTNILVSPDGFLCTYYDNICRLPEWLFKPLGGCCWCFSGQVALWTSVFYFHWINYAVIFQSILLISFTIFFAYIITNTLNKLF